MSEFDKIIGYEDVKTELKKVCDVLKKPDKYASLGVTMPGGLLLFGEPGLGKTLMAKCFIAESGCRSYVIRKEKPNGDFVNEIKAVFEKAKADSPAIVFLDDMDKFANEDSRHPNAEEYVTVQSCIDDCKGYNVFVLATINEKNCLPDSLLRAGRFDRVIELHNPKGKDAQLIIESFLKGKRINNDELDVEELARIMEGHSCAELETIINDAGINAGFGSRDRIIQADVVDACLRMLMEAPECLETISDETRRKIAVHEAGHATVAEALLPGSVSIVSIRRSTGECGGITKHTRGEGYEYSMLLHELEILCSLGGKAATEILYGESDLGCFSDMNKAFNLVETMVDDYCTKGFQNHYFGIYEPAERTKENNERTVATELDRYYEQAKKIIIENRGLFDAIVTELMDHNTITYREMQSLRGRELPQQLK